MLNILKHKRGAPKGNQNALKHGFYSRALNQTDQLDLDLAAGVEGFNEEIALLRFEIKKAVSGGDIKNLYPLVKAAFVLEKLIRTNHRLFIERQTHLQDAVKNAIRDVLLPLGSPALNSVALASFSTPHPPDIKLQTIQKTNTSQNERVLT
ncbi:MAG: hypothetical protein ACYDG5_09655 [Dehalococcoidales bacterium]